MYFNKLGHMVKTFRVINETTIYVGVPRGNKFLNMIALVQQNGAHIKPKASNKSGFLWIPTSNAKGRKPSQIPHLYVRQKKGAESAAAGVDDASSSYGFRVYYVLRRSVNIPARPFFSRCVQRNIRPWSDLIAHKAYQAAIGKIMLTDYFKIIGTRMSNDLKDEIKQYQKIPNAPLTKERKGFNDPLMDTGGLARSITWFSIRNK